MIQGVFDHHWVFLMCSLLCIGYGPSSAAYQAVSECPRSWCLSCQNLACHHQHMVAVENGKFSTIFCKKTGTCQSWTQNNFHKKLANSEILHKEGIARLNSSEFSYFPLVENHLFATKMRLSQNLTFINKNFPS